jgi:hypothetical protein
MAALLVKIAGGGMVRRAGRAAKPRPDGLRVRGEVAGEGGGDLGEEIFDEGAAGAGEVDADEAAIGGVALAADVAVALQVVHHEGEVGGALEDLGGELGLAEGAAVEEGFEHAELGEGEAGREAGVAAGSDGLGGPHEFHEGTEGAAGGGGARRARGRGSGGGGWHNASISKQLLILCQSVFFRDGEWPQKGAEGAK